MTFSIGWRRRDEFGKMQRAEFELIREKARWRVRPGRGVPREEFQPKEQDWDDLLEAIERHLPRGKVTPEDYKIVKRLHARRQGQPGC